MRWSSAIVMATVGVILMSETAIADLAPPSRGEIVFNNKFGFGVAGIALVLAFAFGRAWLRRRNTKSPDQE